MFCNDFGDYLCILFQVFNQLCSSGETFCTKQHSCSNRCENNDFSSLNCRPDEVLCLLTQKCIKKPDSPTTVNHQCTPHHEFNFLSTPSDFKVVYQREYIVSQPGLLFIQEDPALQVEMNQVIGWTSNAEGGKISFSELTENDPTEFIYAYPDINTERIDFSKSSEPQMRRTKHFMSAHIIEPSHFLLEHNYTKTGSYLVTTGNFTNSAIVNIDERIDGIEIQCPQRIFTFTDFEINVLPHSGTNLSYIVDLGDGEETHFYYHNRPIERFQYQRPDVYQVIFTGFNFISKNYSYCQIEVLDDIEGLRFDAIQPVALGNPAFVNWRIEKGTNVTYEVDFGDGKTDVFTEKDLTSMQLKHTYWNVGEYKITVKATNILGSESKIETKINAEIPIGDVEIYSNKNHTTDTIFLQIDEDVDIYVNYSRGSNVKCFFMFNDSTENDEIWTYDKHVTKRFSTSGVFTTHVVCKNAISEVQETFPVNMIVQELVAIKGLRLEVSGGLAFGQDARILPIMDEGSLYTCNLKLGDGKIFISNPSNFTNLVRHRYVDVGAYTIKLSCQNKFGISETSHKIEVDIPPEGLGIVCPENGFARVGEFLEFFVVVKDGTNIGVKVFFGNEDMRSFAIDSNSTIHFNYTYPESGVYQVHVNAANQLSQLETFCPTVISVEHPISNIKVTTNSPLRLDLDQAEFYLSIDEGTPLPTNATITFDFGDNTNLEIDPFPDKHFFTKTHQYNTSGTFQSIVSISNKVDRIHFNQLITIQEVIELRLNFFEKKPNGYLLASSSPNRNVFVNGVTIKINVTRQNRDLKYQFHFGDDSPLFIRDDNFVEYVYQTAGHFNVTVIVQNELGNFRAFREINIQRKIEKVTVFTESEINLGQRIILHLNATDFGSETQGIVNFGDGTVYIINQKKTGEQENRFPPEVNVTHISIDFNSVATELGHLYRQKGNFNITLDLKNEVSFFHFDREVQVFHRICPDPIVQIHDPSTFESPLNIQKSDATLLKSSILLECPEAKNITFRWEVSQGDKIVVTKHQQSLLPIEVIRVGESDPTKFTIEPNVLDFGLAKIRLTVTIGSPTIDLSEVLAANLTWVYVMPSMLKAVIQGNHKKKHQYSA